MDATCSVGPAARFIDRLHGSTRVAKDFYEEPGPKTGSSNHKPSSICRFMNVDQ